MRTIAYVAVVLMLAVIVSGCSAFVEKHRDPTTGETYKTLTPLGETAVEAGKAAVKVATGPLGIPPGVWDAVVAVALGAAGIETTRRVANKVRKSKPGDMVG